MFVWLSRRAADIAEIDMEKQTIKNNNNKEEEEEGAVAQIGILHTLHTTQYKRTHIFGS